MTYLATPYSDPDPAIMLARFEQACQIAGELMNKGEFIYSPIASTHPIAVRCGLPTGWDYWEAYDRQIIAACSKLLVAKMLGWERSKGIAGEVVIAQEFGIPVEYLEVA